MHGAVRGSHNHRAIVLPTNAGSPSAPLAFLIQTLTVTLTLTLALADAYATSHPSHTLTLAPMCCAVPGSLGLMPPSSTGLIWPYTLSSLRILAIMSR